jgi:hypothetical protein
MTFISMHSVIICVVFSGAYMRCTQLCPLNTGVTQSLDWSGGASDLFTIAENQSADQRKVDVEGPNRLSDVYQTGPVRCKQKVVASSNG